MSEMLHDWVWGVACSGAICALCTWLCPEGRVKQVLQMACACVMMFAMYAPLRGWNPDGYAEMITAYREESRAVVSQSEAVAERLNRMVIEQEYREYILDKAQTCGEPLEDVSVGVKWDDGGYWIPWEAVYCQDISLSFQETIERDLGIPKERQSIREADE